MRATDFELVEAPLSAAAGATGNVAGQLARLRGCRVVGITSTTEKRRLLLEELRFDAALDRRSQNFARDLRAACPEGVGLYLDLVGGSVLDAVLGVMNVRGRVVCGGSVASYDGGTVTGPRAVPGLVISQRLSLKGFVVLDHVDRWPAAPAEIASFVADHRLRVLERVVGGLEAALQGLVDLLAGNNVGTWMVRVGGPE